MEAAQLKVEFLRLLKEDEEFRYAVAGLLGFREILDAIRSLQEQVAHNTEAIRALQEQVAEHSKTIRALQEQVARNTEAIRALQEQVAEHSKAIRALQEQVRNLQEQVRALQEQVRDLQEQVRALQEQVARHSEVIERHSARIEELARSIQALGARWGILAEESFREAMKGVIERFFGGEVRRWTYHDSEGFVFGYPSTIEVDLLITDREHMLVEVKSSVSRADVFELWRIGQLYEKLTGVRPRLAVISPFVRPEARKAAEELGIEVYTSLGL